MSHKSSKALQEEAQCLLNIYGPQSSSLKVKERQKIPAQVMPVQDPELRSHNMEEVSLGYSLEQAKVEALRCLQCAKKNCIEGCPVQIDIPRFIGHISKGEIEQAIAVVKETTLLPAVCGRVCPQERQCQLYCTLGKSLKDIGSSVAIGGLERFVADWERINNKIVIPSVKPATGKKVAVVGSGPAGLVVAADCRREGHHVTIFEAFHKLGGVLRYGIPEFRLPNDIIDKEIETLSAMGVEIKTNFVVGRTRKLTDLIDKDGYDAVFIGTGAGLPIFMGIEGESLNGVLSANEYLTRINLMKAYLKDADTPVYLSKKLVVLGGGNVAMDAARMAKRLGAESVTVVYRRTENEMPARREEVIHAKEEGIRFLLLSNANRILGDEKGAVKGIECLQYELGEADASGRRSAVEIANSEFILEADTVIIAVGNGSNPLISQTTPLLTVSKRGNIVVDETQQTSMDKIFAGGDIVLGAATVILAMGEGRRSAASINKLLCGPAVETSAPSKGALS